MKVIFIKDMKGVAKLHDIKNMPDGYAQNFLIPRGFAVLATQPELEKVKKIVDTIRVEKAVQSDLLEKNLKQVHGIILTVKVKANESGHLFSSIHSKDIASLLYKEKHIELDPETIVLPKPIKELGTHTITVAVKNHKTTFELTIESLTE